MVAAQSGTGDSGVISSINGGVAGLDALLAMALVFLTPAALIGLGSAPLAVRTSFVTVLRLGILATLGVTAVAAIFALDKPIIFVLMLLFGVVYNGLLLTSSSGMGVVQAPDDAPRFAARHRQCLFRHRRLDRICLGRNDCRAGHRGRLTVRAVDLRRDRGGRTDLQPGAQSQAAHRANHRR